MTSAAPEVLVTPTGHKLRVWDDLVVRDVQRRLQEGDPILGWEGDPNLLLGRDQLGWVLCRLGDDGFWHMICREQTGDPKQLHKLIPMLVRNDSRREDVAARLRAEREAREARQEAEAAEKLTEDMKRVHAGLRRDVGHLHGLTSTRFL